MKKVNFTEMKNGSKDEYLFLDKLEKEYVGETADRILNFLSRMTTTLEGYKITRLEHSLQSATKLLEIMKVKRWLLRVYCMILEMN